MFPIKPEWEISWKLEVLNCYDFVLDLHVNVL